MSASRSRARSAAVRPAATERPTAEQVRAGFDELARMLVEMSPSLKPELFAGLCELTELRDRMVKVVAEKSPAPLDKSGTASSAPKEKSL